MKIDEYISDLRKKNIIISVKEGKISLKGSKEKITPEVIKELTAKKQDILTFFKSIKKVKEFESIKPAPKQNYYPLSSSQLRMYFLYNFDKESTSYNVPGFYRVSRNLDVLKLEQVFQKLSDRHHSLRTVFEIVDGNPVQRVLDSNSLKVTRHQGTASDINRYMDSFVRPFDLSKELPIRISLMEVLEEDYLLMIDMHHIINDGVSSEVLMHDFWSLYQGNVLPDLPIQYIDYAVWQQSDVYKDLISSHKEYWLDRYSDEFTVLEIPTDYTRPIQLGNEGSAYTLSLSKKQSDKLRDFASSHGATMYMLFLAIYNVLLNKLSNQDDIIIGTPTVGRRHSDLEGIVGLFVNTLALRNQITSNVSFSDLLAKIQEDTLKAFDHQLYPYEELIDALDVSRNVGRNPLFNVFFSYNQQEGSTSSSNDSDLKIVNHEVLYNIAKFDLELDIINQGDYYDMLFSYNLSLFDEKTIKRFSTYLEAIIEQIVTEGNIKISEIDILSKEEKSQIIHEFNAPETNYNIKGTVVDLIEEQVFFNPKAKALYFKNHTIDYGELNSKANKLAHYLINVMGVQKGDQVGVHFGRSPEMIIGFLAVLKSGAAYVSLDPENPSSRINLLIENSNLKFILTNSYEKLLAINTSVEVIDLIREGLNIGEMPSNNPLVKIKENDPAYIIYTSGSTGKPKGIVIEHSSLVDYSITFKEYFSLTTSDKVVQQASPAFDTVVEEVFPALLTGASIVIMPDGGKNIEFLLKEIKETKATILSTVPVVVDALNNYSDALESLRLIVSGGDVLLPRHISNLIEKYPIYNTYGPSESTVCITYHKVSSLDNTSCIGKPIPNRQVYILNKDKQLCPVGVTGELCVSGKGLAKEYLNDKKLTEDKFIKNPIIPTSRIYRTGDTAKWNSDGTIEFLGRVDNQVKIRGVRIELGEIESQLESIDIVSQALVLASGSENNKQLIAYLCGVGELDDISIATLLSSKLPDYMIPSGYIWLDSFPVNSNGKIDRRALPSPDLTSEEKYVAPETNDQQKLVKIWSEVLDLEEDTISITSDFFRLGGHSLLAITLTNKINQVFNIEVSLKDLFSYRTILELSTYISEKEHVQFESIPKALESSSYPLSSAQRRMYFLYEFDKGSTSYNMPMFYRVGRDLDVSQLDKVFKELVSRHQSLRTVFELEEGYPVQRVLEATNFNIAYKQGNPSDVDRYVSEFVQPFNLAEELAYRVSLIDITGEDYLLMIDSHHIINDGVSNEILMKGFWSLYHGESLPSLSIDYIDYSVWQQSEGYQDLVSSHKTYWLDKYSEELTALELPTDYPRSQDQSTEGDVHSITLSKKQSEELRKIAASEGVTMYTLFLGIYTILLSKLSNQEDIVVGTPTAGRHHADLEEVVGMFVNTLALRNQVASGTSFQEFLSELQVNTLMAFDHQLYQYEELVDALDVSRDSGRNPLFDVFYSYNQYQEVTDIEESESLKIVGHDVSYTIAKFDLMLDVLDSESIVLSLNYRTDLYSSSSIARFSGYLNKIIDSVLDNKEKQLKDIDILSTSEKDRLLLGLNTTKVNYDLEETVLDMFRSKVEEFPNSIALVMEGKNLTYQELDARSDLWATHLMSLGVVKGSIVGLMMTRSLEMITGILGIMKAGGAYLPINVDQPLSRTHHMLEECKVSFVLSNLNDLSEEIKANYSYLSSSVLDKKLNVNKKELPVVTSDDVAYVIYTSGSTGNPKGVLVAYKGITNLNCFQREFFDIGTADRILQFSPYYFDASVEQIWLALTSGGTMVLIGREVLLDPTLFKNYLLENKITYLHSTPSFLENLPIDELPFLKIVISGGEKCTPSLANKFLGKSRFINEYGPTEGTVVSMAYEVLEKLNTNVPIGRPIANTQAYILDKDLNLLPEGTTGELYIGGVHLAEGYVNNVTLTEERFIGNPFGKGSLYKTGDLVKWLPEGDLEYLGRNDHQVKIRGYRIELGEIESVLEEVPSINQALVLAHGTGVNKQLVAYLCCNEVIEEQDIILLLSGMLPDYMVPLSYIYLDSFPLNANGKIDRKSLPIPNLIDKEAYVAPTNETETSLVHIWSEILDLEENEVSITSDFFRLGGHSLLAITLLNKVNKIFNVEVSLRDLFSYRTILELSTYILEKDHVQFESIPKALESESYPLSSAQRRMYFLYEYEKDGTSYNMPTFYRVGRDLDVSQLDKAFKELVSRHQVLRTVFELIDGHPVQQVLKDVNFEIDYKQGAASDIKNYVSEFVQPFNLAENLPYRVSLIDITGEDYLLMIDSHHIINDGVSNGILTRDIWSLYYGESLPNLSIEYIDYSVWQQSESYQDLVSNHKKYWLDKYSEELTALELPTDYPRSQVRNNEGGVHSLILNKKQSEELRKIAASEGVTMYTLFLGIYTILLSKLSNQEDIVIGTPTAGRLHADVEDVVGMFVNTLALRNQVTSGTSFQDFLSGLQTDTLMAFDHQLFQYEELVDALDVSRDSGRNPLFDVFYSYNQEKTYVEESERLKVVGYEADYNVAKFDLELDVVEQEEGCGVFFSYNLSLFKEKTIERFSKGFEKIIAEIIADKEIEISKINILSNQESNQIIKEFNAPEINYNIKGTIVDLIEKQVLLNPLAEALYYKGYTMSYQDLNLKVNQLTHYLIEVIKVKKGDRIGVYLGRSPEMIISFLAVLKSGATYIALDPNNPLDRLKMLIDGSEMKYILTNLSIDLVNLETSVSVIDLIIDKVKIEKMPEINPLLSIKGNDTAYIIFTSGSTGKPKGVIIEHNSLVDYSITFKKYFSLTPLDKVIQQASPSFDTVVEEIFPALLTGASLVIMPEGGRDIEALIHGIKETKATVLTTVPVVLDVLNKYSDDLQSLRFIVSGGDVLLPRHIDNLINHYPIFNTYGPSESTVCITYHEIDSLEKTSCIGKPINNRQVYILNEAKQLCPIGVSGELYVSGKGLAKGYLNDDKLTENKFIENPVIPGVRAYATGDLAKWNEDGTIDFLGRIDNQIKIRGLRIELGEIEYQLEKIESINKSLVIASGEGESKQLVAYLCGNINIEESSIKNILSSKLPNYMIPTTYIKVDNFPVNSNGKIDRKLLPSPNFTTGSEYIAPNNEVQKKLLSIWSEVLRAKESEISITSDFFKLGGHSLLAMEMKHKISKYMNAEFQLSEIFLAPTIASLSLKIEQKKNEDIKVVDVIPLNKRETEDKLFVIHDGSGEVDGYLELTRNIKEYQCYGIKFEHDYDIISAPSINEIASVYIEKIKSIQPTGPYNLLGWSLGGEIATEIALQLETYNEKVEKLIIIDSYLGYEKPAKETLFNVDSELELFSSLFSFNPINKQEFYSLKGLQDELFNSEPFKALTSNQMQDLIPQSIKQLIPDYINKTKEELFTATSKIRLLVASSDNNWINKQVKANTLYICPSQSINNQNIDKLKSVFVNINISNIPGDHFSIMKAPRVMPLSNLINKHFELTLVSLE